MTPALAKTTNDNALEDLGRATLQIVHDLKNQLNGLKLYATFLRKRLEREERSPEERDTIVKLIAGLDRAAKDLTALVRYSQPVDLNRQPHIDLRNLISGVIRDVASRLGIEAPLACEIESSPLYGEFDPSCLSEALQALTEEAVNSLPSRQAGNVSLHVRREGDDMSSQAIIEWKGFKLADRNQSFRSATSYGTVYTAQAARIIEAHGGRVEREPNAIRAWLPLSK
ncbi:MAG: two-component system, OmpR family, sensor histidine kinase MtrB [Blastocatellia bacterium]|nr:two-component system, OmpR family, sensor histidine kinase MtrB [Blastocatellia bacterium]